MRRQELSAVHTYPRTITCLKFLFFYETNIDKLALFVKNYFFFINFSNDANKKFVSNVLYTFHSIFQFFIKKMTFFVFDF